MLLSHHDPNEIIHRSKRDEVAKQASGRTDQADEVGFRFIIDLAVISIFNVVLIK